MIKHAIPLALLTFLAAAGCAGAVPTAEDATRDVTVSGCEVTDLAGTKFVTGTVVITNSTDRAQSYAATISVNGADGIRIGEINAVSNSLGAGQTVTLTGANATGNADASAVPGPAQCTVANVTRFAT